MFTVVILIVLACLNLLFSYLGTHDSTQALPKEKKFFRVGQFLVVGALCILLASLLAINSYRDQRRSEATAAADEHRKADWEARIEALLAEKCSRLAGNNSVMQQCLDGIRTHRTEPSRPASQGQVSAGPRSDSPIHTGTGFLRSWYTGALLTNPFSRPLNPLVDLVPEPKHYSAPLDETLSSSMGVYRDGTLGGPYVTSTSADRIADGSY
jgi:hypothetical protein